MTTLEFTSPTAAANAGAVTVRSARRALEMPTLLLVLAVYAAWMAVTFQYGHWSLWLLAPVGTLVISLHSSLQHEIVHGHPTRWYAVNRLLGIVPLSLWLPLRSLPRCYRTTTSMCA
jgi:fatty acid desaturase